MVSNELRDSILGRKNKNPVIQYNININLDFDLIPTKSKDTLLTNPYVYLYGLKEGFGRFKDKLFVDPKKEDLVEITFSNIYQPSYK